MSNLPTSFNTNPTRRCLEAQENQNLVFGVDEVFSRVRGYRWLREANQVGWRALASNRSSARAQYEKYLCTVGRCRYGYLVLRQARAEYTKLI